MIPTEKNIAKMKAKKAGAGNIKKIDNKLIESALRDNTTQAFRIIFFLAQELSGLDLPPDDQVLKIKIDLTKITDFTLPSCLCGSSPRRWPAPASCRLPSCLCGSSHFMLSDLQGICLPSCLCGSSR